MRQTEKPSANVASCGAGPMNGQYFREVESEDEEIGEADAHPDEVTLGMKALGESDHAKDENVDGNPEEGPQAVASGEDVVQIEGRVHEPLLRTSSAVINGRHLILP